MHTTGCSLDNVAGGSLIRSPMIYMGSAGQIKRKDVPQLQTKTKKNPLPLERIILLHLRLGELSIRIWFGVAPHLAIEILLGTSSTKCFTRRIFPAERKVVFCPSQPEALLAQEWASQGTRPLNTLSHILKQAVSQNADNNFNYNVIRVARQVILQPNMQIHVLVTT